MNLTKLIILFICSTISTHALAYGSSSSSKKACNKPKFTQFTPIHLAAIKPESEFSFLASALTAPETIVVSVKKQAVSVTINKTNKGYSITGKLPASLQSTYARIAITATGMNSCKGSDGWLLKID
jgi:uncharacterized membrane protein